jgi:PhoH-like ATPase
MTEPKHYLLDTSCLIDDPNVIWALGTGGNHVYVHEMVLQELDKIKNDYHEEPFVRGNAKEALGRIRDLLFSTERPQDPIPYNEGQAIFHAVSGKEGARYTHGDPALLDYLKESDPRYPLTLISEDTGLLSLALVRGYKAEVRRDARKGRSLHEIFNMQEEIDLPPDKREELRQNRSTRLSSGELEILPQLFQNQYLFLTGEGMSVRHTRDGNYHTFTKLMDRRGLISGIKPKNKEQGYLMDLALDPNITLGSAIGKAGTGKTLILLAAALHQVETDGKYKKVVIIRPLSTVGEGVGYLPGDLDEKLAPFMQPIADAIDVIQLNQERGHRREEERGGVSFGLESYVQEGIIEIMPPTFARGRNITGSFIIVDEAQNLNQNEVKTLATRCGDGSKVIFNGDPYQIDARYLDQEKNGLVYLTKRLLNQPLFSAVIVKKGERSAAAELAAELL